MSSQSNPQIVIPAEQVQKRVRELARQISHDYAGKTVHVLGVLENSSSFSQTSCGRSICRWCVNL